MCRVCHFTTGYSASFECIGWLTKHAFNVCLHLLSADWAPARPLRSLRPDARGTEAAMHCASVCKAPCGLIGHANDAQLLVLLWLPSRVVLLLPLLCSRLGRR